MILWTIKLLKEVRQAIAGRRYPAQLAWAVAFGILLGIIPHGNLLALSLLLVVLSLKLNHAMAGLTAIATSFLASWLDPYSHQLGNYVLTHPRVSEAASAAWQWPLVPWTDLNNTVVMGSMLIGTAAVLPTFFVAYPIFRALAPHDDAESALPDPTPPEGGLVRPDREATLNGDHRHLAGPHHSPQPARATAGQVAADEHSHQHEDGAAENEDDSTAVETRIEVIRMKDYRKAEPDASEPGATDEPLASDDDSEPMDEALRYLLRQLRDSQQRKAA